MQTRVFQLLVDNNSGVLSRITGLFSRRGYNIESITAGVTAVRDIHELKPDKSVYRELCLIKVRSTPDKRQAVIACADIFRAKIIDVNMDSLVVELTGNQSKIDAFIALLQDYEILELARTGITGLGRGTEDVVYLE